ncbi:phosphopantetheine-binding protein [Streptomyces sp. TBY4]|uniref:phosphopantetheine-binding protein n=1 Tax=Streptomyces sp. TBY4 TaxID=2962030 RepID=UPI0020B64617|nr:phosphopantetheine-binding protein [Streptomyces sp. TBY4]MCP3760518.1 phosphopantetheine-binding protein [Streptomyces sp. TBY4]
MTELDIPESFQDVLRPHLPYAESRALAAADELPALGLDSMGVVQLLADLEDTYGLELPDEFLTEQTFETVGSLWSTVAPLATPRQAGDE